MPKRKRPEVEVISAQSDVITLEENQTVEGFFQSYETSVGKNESNIYHFVDLDEKPYSIWGSASLDPLLMQARKDDFVVITYLGKKKTSGGNSVKVYKVEGSKAFAARGKKVIDERIAEASKKKARKNKNKAKSS